MHTTRTKFECTECGALTCYCRAIPDAYTEGYCKRCGRVRTECQKIIDTGKRCTEVKDKPEGR